MVGFLCLLFFFLSFFLSLLFGSGMPGCCLHTAVWLLILLSVGVNASFPAQCQSTLPSVHPGRLEDLVRREKESTGCHSAGPALRVSHTVHPGRRRPARWAGTSQASPPHGAPVPHPVQKRKTCNEALHDMKVGGWHTGAKPHYRRTEVVRSCLAASNSLQGSPSWPLPPQLQLPHPKVWALSQERGPTLV